MFWHHWFAIGSIFAGIGIGLGSFEVISLRKKMNPNDLHLFDSAVRYQMYHACALFAVSFASTRVDNLALKFSGFAFILGMLLYSGSLHALLFFKNSSWWAGPITPIGSICFFLGWFLLGFSAFL